MIVNGQRGLRASGVALAALVAAPAWFASPGAFADTAPDGGLPATVSADALPTAQIDGVAWDQEIVGNTVFVGGKFTSTRPAGAAAGQQTSPRSNLMSYTLDSGKATEFAPKVNGEVKAITASPDGKRIYVGGAFTEIDGQKAFRLAAFDVATGKLDPNFKPVLDYRVTSIAVAGDNVYVGGQFSSAGGKARSNLAAFDAKTGAVQPWSPAATGGQVLGITLSPDKSKLVVVGQFLQLGGRLSRGWGAVDVASGKVLPWQGASWLQASGKDMGLYSVSSDAKNVYVTAFSWGQDNFEGIASATWEDGGINWIADCYGDSYDSAPMGGSLYYVSHNHHCEHLGGKPETKPRTYMRANALSTARSIKGNTNTLGQFMGKPAPDILHWYPDLEAGSFTGTNQGAWTAETGGGYVALGGEFPRVNGIPQQGLVRFAVKEKAPNKSGPIVTGGKLAANVRVEGGNVRADVDAAWDRDNANLTYSLMRGNEAIAEIKASSIFYNTPHVKLDGGKLAPGKQQYRVRVTDPSGNALMSDPVELGEGAAPAPAPGKPGGAVPAKPGGMVEPNKPGGGVVEPMKPGGGVVEPAKPGEHGKPKPGGSVVQPPKEMSFFEAVWNGLFGGEWFKAIFGDKK